MTYYHETAIEELEMLAARTDPVRASFTFGIPHVRANSFAAAALVEDRTGWCRLIPISVVDFYSKETS